jgi:hypothetical protein
MTWMLPLGALQHTSRARLVDSIFMGQVRKRDIHNSSLD